MDGGQFFSSLFSELLHGSDCASVLEDHRADPMEKEICKSFQQFSSHIPSGLFVEQADQLTSKVDDPVHLRESILSGSKTPSSQNCFHGPDEVLDESSSDGIKKFIEEPLQSSHSYSVTITRTRSADGTIEEKTVEKDCCSGVEKVSLDQVTTVVYDNSQNHKKTETAVHKLISWLWPTENSEK